MIFFKGSFMNYNDPMFLANGDERQIREAQIFIHFVMEKFGEFQNGKG